MGTIANAKVTHYYNCYNGDFIGCLLLKKLFVCDIARYLVTRFGKCCLWFPELYSQDS